MNQQMGLHEIKKLLYNKRNGFQIEEATHRMGENSYHLYVRQGTDNQNMQVAQKTKLKKINGLLKKWVKELKSFFKGRSPNGQKTH
jgi:repressor of nif and glnA expression